MEIQEKFQSQVDFIGCDDLSWP